MSLNPQLYPPLQPVAVEAARPFWSVIVPAYKPDYLAQALRSVMDQDPGPQLMEILVLDDCSPHALEPIVREICGQRVTYFRQPRNLGTYANENSGLAMSRGLWIHILNDDDWVLPGFYATFHQSLQNQPPNVGAACCLQSNVDSAGALVSQQAILRDSPGMLENFLVLLSTCNPTHPVGTVIRRSTFERLGGFYRKLNYCADWDLNKRAACFYDWWYEPQLMACYRRHDSSVSHEGFESGAQLLDFRRSIEISDAYLPAGVRAQITARSREAFGNRALRMARHSLQRGEISVAMHEIQIGLDVTSSPRMLQQLAALLAEPFAAKLRELPPNFFKPNPNSTGQPPIQSDSAKH